jgi:hypothetical protein
MKSKQAAGSKKQAIIVKDLKTRKNPKGGALLAWETHEIKVKR